MPSRVPGWSWQIFEFCEVDNHDLCPGVAGAAQLVCACPKCHGWAKRGAMALCANCGQVESERGVELPGAPVQDIEIPPPSIPRRRVETVKPPPMKKLKQEPAAAPPPTKKARKRP